MMKLQYKKRVFECSIAITKIETGYLDIHNPDIPDDKQVGDDI